MQCNFHFFIIIAPSTTNDIKYSIITAISDGVGFALVVRCWRTMCKVVSSTPAQDNLHSAGLAHKYA